MFVCGAIASTSAASPITAPAESALEPGRGDVDDRRGSLAARIALTILRIDEPRARPACPSRSRPRRSRSPLAALDRVDQVVLRHRVDVVRRTRRRERGDRPSRTSRTRERGRLRPRPRGRVRKPAQRWCSQPPESTSRPVRIRSSKGRGPCGRKLLQPRCRLLPVPKRLLLLLGFALVLPANAWAGDATIVSRDVPLAGERALAGSAPPARFNMVGLHWQGPGVVSFRTRSLAGRWSEWVDADAEPEDQPNGGSAERARTRAWRLGNPWWVGPVEPDRVSRAGPGHPAARLLRLELRPRRSCQDVSRRPARRRSCRAAPGAQTSRSGAQALLRAGRAACDRPSHGRLERLRAGRGAGDRPGDRDLPREGKRLERHRLQLPRRPLRPGLRGSVRRDRAERDRRPRAGLQHRLGRRRGARRVQLARASRRRRATRSSGSSRGDSISRTSIRRAR